jgi:hypothetical protein
MSTYQAEIDYFAERAKEFLVWCQTPQEGKDQKEIQRESLQMLSILYAAVWLLPNVEPRLGLPEAPAVKPEHLQNVTQNIKILPFQYYWEMFKPSEVDVDNAPVCGDLFEDFQDVYTDLVSGLWFYQQGHVDGAAFEWRIRFANRWGRRAIGAMHALHLFEPKEAEDLLD